MLIQRMKEGDTAPILYTMYDKKYDFNDLQRVADSGLEQYLSTLKRGLKDREKFIQAYLDLMTGIKDGTITFSNGRYHDSLGRYDNVSDDKKVRNGHKDYYGIMAHYIFGLQGLGNEYKAPEDNSKIKWNGAAGLASALNKTIYNSDSGNIKDFIEIDAIDPTTNRRGTTGRTKALALAYQSIYDNFDNLFTEYTDADKQLTLSNLKEAIGRLNDGTIDAGDYLSLNKAVGGVDYRNMFTDSYTAPKEEEATTTPTQTGFAEWLLSHYPAYEGNLRQPSTILSRRTFGPGTTQRLYTALYNASDKLLTSIIRNLLGNKLYVFNNDSVVLKAFGDEDYGFDAAFGLKTALQVLKDKGKLILISSTNPDVYYIPNTRTPNNTAWVYNAKDNTIGQMSIHDIPYWADKIAKEYLKETKGASAWISLNPIYSQLISSNKKGGILKALEGTNSNIFFNNEDFGYNSYLNKIWLQQDVLDWMRQHYTGNDATAKYEEYVKNNVNGRYTAGINNYTNGLRYTGNEAVRTFNNLYLNNGDTLNYLLFGNSEDDYNNRLNGIVYSLADFNRPSKPSGTGDSYNSEAAKAYIDNALGALTYSRVASLTDPSIKAGNFGEWGKYWKSLGNTGAYYYIAEGDTSGKGLWIPTSDTSLNGYQAFDTALVDGSADGSSDGSDIDPHADPQGTKVDFDKAISMLPDLLGAGRLWMSLKTNNNIAKTLRESLKPTLINTYERFSPITGAFLEMLLRNKQGADIVSRMSRPLTSDASLQLAGQYEAQKRAEDLLYLGFLADNKEIKRTANESLLRQEDNMKRRMDVANTNRAAINQTNRERAQLEASRLKQNWLSWDNFIKGIEDRYRTKYDSEEERRNQFRLQTDAAEIEKQYNEAIEPIQRKLRLWARATGKSITEAPEYANYTRLLKDLNNWKAGQLYSSHAKVYGYDYANPETRTILQIVYANHFKNGGRL